VARPAQREGNLVKPSTKRAIRRGRQGVKGKGGDEGIMGRGSETAADFKSGLESGYSRLAKQKGQKVDFPENRSL